MKGNSMFEDLFQERLHHIHLDFHTPEFPACAVKKLDTEGIIKALADAKVNAVKVFTKDHYGNSYYNTKVGHKHSGLKEDMFGEMVKYAKQYDIKVIAYYSICCEYRAATQNPDWAQRDIEGNTLGVGGFWKDICINSAYRYEWVYPQLSEIINNYDFDGFWLDMLYFLPKGCYCDNCKKLFREQYGQELAEADNKIVKQFRVESMRKFLGEVNHLIKESGKQIAVMANGCGFIEQARDGHAQNLMGRQSIDLVDCHVVEAQPAWDGYALLSAPARYMRTLDKPFEILCVRFIAHWGEWTFKPVTQLKYEFSTILSNGGIISCGDQAYPEGTIDPQSYKNIGEAFEFIEPREKFIKGAKTVKHTAVLNYNNNYLSVFGASKMLIESHIQFDIIDIEEIDNISDYSVLICDNVGDIDEKYAEKIRGFVSEGGTLIACHDSCVNSLSDVLGVDFQGKSTYTVGYICGLFDYPVLVKDEAFNFKSTTAKKIADFVYPITNVTEGRFFSHLDAPPANKSFYPSITVNEYKKGKAIYICFPLFKAFWQTQHYPLKSVFQKIAEDNIEPFIKTDAPSSIEINIMEKEQELIVNFVNFHCERPGLDGYPYIENIPSYQNISFAIKADKPKEITLEPGGQKLNYDYENNYVKVVIPQINIYEILALKY